MTTDCVEFCKALADDTRQRILEMLLAAEGGLCVSEIVRAFGVSQPTISHHLSILRRLGLVTSRREGKEIYYSVNRERIVACCGRLVAKINPEEVCPD